MKAYEVTNPEVQPIRDECRPLKTEADLIAACAERGGVWSRYLMEEIAIFFESCDQGRCPICVGFSDAVLVDRQESCNLLLQQYGVTWQPDLRF